MQNKSVDVLRVGKVFSVNGRKIEILVDKTKNSSHLLFNGEILRNVSVGSFVKITKGFSQLIGKIESEFITEDKDYSKSEYKKDAEKIKRILTVSLVGYLDDNSFEQGIKELPLIDNECYILTEKEYNQVHKFTKDGEETIKIGELASETSRNIELGVNSLFASHIGIFGNTGSGKSYTLASIYHSLFKQYQDNSGFQKNARFLLIDFNGEYLENESGDNVICNNYLKETFDLPNNKIEIERYSIEKIEILSIILDATEKTQKPFLKGVLNYSKFKDQDFCPKTFIIKNLVDSLINKKDKEFGTKAFFNLFNDLYDCVDNKEIIYEIRDLITDELGHYTTGSYYSISVENGAGNKSSRTGNNAKFEYENLSHYFIYPLENQVNSLSFHSENLLNKFLLKLILKYHLDIINGHSNVEHISPLIRRAKTTLLKLDKLVEIVEKVESDKNLKVVSLKNINDNALKKILALVICKEHYDKQKAEKADGSYLNIIIDEAHNILSHNSMRESETWKDYRLETFEEIIKEGRKFGTFLTIASQRPYDISPTIVSQLHNYFLHRLINNKDIEAIERTVSYLDKVSFESMPILPTGTCIIAGLSAKLPVVVKMNPLKKEFQPNSHTIKLTDYWGNVEAIVGTEDNIDLKSVSDEDDLPF